MTELTVKISVPVDVSRNALGLWVAGMLNMPVVATDWLNFEDTERRDLDLLDEMEGDVEVTWEVEHD